MKILLKAVSFSLLVIGVFWGYSNFGIPQIRPADPPGEEKVDLAAMDMERFIALGKKSFHGKGACDLCHNSMGRAPMLDKIGAVAAERLKDPRYRGTARTVEEYLMESLVKPSAFVVAGFGKVGTNDTESPMPDVTGSGIGLGEAELKAVIAYMQDSSGSEVTVKIPAMAPPAEDGAARAEEAPLNTPEEVIVKYGCGVCHAIAGQTGTAGPDLSGMRAKSRDYLRQAILDPDAVIAKGYAAGMMPMNYGEQMRAKEVEMLVNYMAGQGK